MTQSTNSQAWYSLATTHGVLVVSLHANSVTSDMLLAEFQKQVIEELQSAATAVLIDCHCVSGRASTQLLTAILAIRAAARERNLFLCLCRLQGSLREAFQTCRLENIIPVYEDRDTALEAVGDYSIEEIKQRKVERAHQAVYQSTMSGAAEDRGSRKEIAARWSRLKPSRSTTTIMAFILWTTLCVAIVWSGILLSQPAPPGTPKNVAPPAFHLEGQIVLISGRQRIGDGGAVVLAWPIDPRPEAGASTREIRRFMRDRHRTLAVVSNVRIARASSLGQFCIPIYQAGEYSLLVLSGNRRNTAGLVPEDEERLAATFDDPSGLVGQAAYRIRQATVDGANARVVETFALASKN